MIVTCKLLTLLANTYIDLVVMKKLGVFIQHIHRLVALVRPISLTLHDGKD